MKAITSDRQWEARWAEYLSAQMKEYDKAAFKKVLSTKEGRWFFSRLLDMTGYKAQSFTGNSQTFYNEGRRAVGIALVTRLADLLGFDGIKSQQKAEREYVEFQEQQKMRYWNEEE